MGTVLEEIVTPALRKIGVLAEGEQPSAAQATDALADLNSLIDQYAAERLQIFHTTRTVFDLVAEQASYLLSAEFDHPNPDGFDTPWSGAPEGWTPLPNGTATINNETTTVNRNGHAVRFDGSVSLDQCAIFRDFVVQPGTTLTLTVYTFATFTSAGFVRIYNQDTGNYLDSTSAWGGVQADAIESPAGAAYVLKTISFDVEDESVIGAKTTTLRVTLLLGAVNASVYFDTFAIAGLATVPVPRPIYIDRVSILDPTLDTPYEIPLTKWNDAAYEQQTVKDLQSTFPSAWYYNPTFPYGTLTFWPVPSSATYDAVIYVPTQVAQFEAITDTFEAPPGYLRMLVNNLALELCPSYEKQPHPLLMKAAAESLAAVKRANQRPTDLAFDSGALIGGRPFYGIAAFRSGQ